jgi:hypothetical protein
MRMSADRHVCRVSTVRDHGAVGDGVTDDTKAVQAAIDAGGVTVFPPGTYSCGTLTMRRASHLVGTNSGTYTYSVAAGYLDDYRPGEVSRLVRRPGTNGPLIDGPLGAKRVVIEDLQLDGNAEGQPGCAAPVVDIADAPASEDTQWVISRCFVRGGRGPGPGDHGGGGSNVYIGAGRMACHVTHTVSNYATTHGFEVNGADTVVESCIVGDNGGAGVTIGAWVTTITTCALFNNTHGIYVADTGDGSPKRILICANGIDRNRQNGILVDRGTTSGAAGVSIMNNAFTTNSTDGDDTWAHVNIRATTGHVALGGNVFSVVEDGYAASTTAAVFLGPGASALDMGNIYEGGSVGGFTNRPTALYSGTRMG